MRVPCVKCMNIVSELSQLTAHWRYHLGARPFQATVALWQAEHRHSTHFISAVVGIGNFNQLICAG
jgi:hypothetical protein